MLVNVTVTGELRADAVQGIVGGFKQDEQPHHVSGPKDRLVGDHTGRSHCSRSISMLCRIKFAVKTKGRHAGRFEAILKSGKALPDHDGSLIGYGIIDHNALQALQE